MSISWHVECLVHNCITQDLNHFEFVAMKMRRECDKYFNATRNNKYRVSSHCTDKIKSYGHGPLHYIDKYKLTISLK